MSDSEFGKILGATHKGTIISSEGHPHHYDGTVVWVSSAFNPINSAELRNIADYMDRIRDGN
jgi:hypothetical protein